MKIIIYNDEIVFYRLKILPINSPLKFSIKKVKKIVFYTMNRPHIMEIFYENETDISKKTIGLCDIPWWTFKKLVSKMKKAGLTVQYSHMLFGKQAYIKDA